MIDTQPAAPENPCHALLREMLNAGWSHHIPEDVRGEMDALLNKGDASHG